MNLEKKTSISLLLDFYSAMLTERQAEVMQLYYGDDLSLKEVSEMTGITRQGVRDAVKRSEMILEDCEEKLKLREKYEQRRAVLERITGDLNACGVPAELIKQIEELIG